jgi:hypothetical protein
MGVDLEGCSGQTREVVLLPLLAVLVALGPGAFDPRFEWVGDDVCPGAAASLALALSDYLGPAALGSAAGPEHVEASLSFRDQGPAGLRLQLGIVSDFGREQHELQAADCDRLIDQAALLLAGVIDPFVAFAIDEAPSSAARHHGRHEQGDVAVQGPTRTAIGPDPIADAGPAASSIDVAAVVDDASETRQLGEFGPLVATDPARRPRILGAIGVGATAFAGVFPQVGGGVELEGALERGALRWQNAASGWFGGRFRSSEAEVGADLWALGFASSLCGVPAVRRVRVPLCAVGGVGAMRARAVGTIEPRSSTQPWVWAGAEVSLQVLARQDLAIALGVGAYGILLRPGWEIRAPDVSYTLPPVMGLLRLTLEVRELGRKKTTSPEIGSR